MGTFKKTAGRRRQTRCGRVVSSIGAIAPLLTLVGATAIAGTTANAQATTSRLHEFHIPAQPINRALGQLAAQAGLQLAYQTADVDRTTAPAVDGTMTAQEALSRILAGTSLKYTFSSSNVVTISGTQTDAGAAPGSEGATTLQPIVLQAAGATTEGTNSYNASAVTVAGKIAVPVREIPNSVSVITRKQIEDQNLNSVNEILRQTPGVTDVNYGDGTYYFQSRGYPLDAQYDGMPVTGGIQYLPQFDSSIYDRVEVLKGPAGLLQGAGGGPAGTANFVRRPASDVYSLTADTQIGSWNFYRSTVDVTGPLNADKTARGRLIITGQDRDFFYDNGKEWHGTAYGNLALDVTPDTTITVSGAYQRQKLAPFDYGQAVYSNGKFLDVPRSAFFGTDWSYNNQNIAEGYANVEHHFDDDWVWNTTMLYRQFGGDSKYGYMAGVVNPATNMINYTLQSGDLTQKWFGLDTNLTGSYDLFGRSHKLLIGANYAHTSNDYKSGGASIGLVNIYDTSSIPEIDLPYTSGSLTESQQWGLYGQTRLSLADPLTLILGGRESWYDSKSRSTLPTTTDWTDAPSVRGKFSPYVGVVYDLTKQFSVYASYAHIFTPQSQLTSSGRGVDPRTGRQYEVGVKGEFFDGALTATLAAFDIRDNHRAVTDPAAPLYYVSAGKAQSRGIEFTVSGEVTDNWNVMAGYTYLQTKYLEDPTSAGDVLDPEEPKHSFKLWNKYTFDSGHLEGFSIGGGARIVSTTQRGPISQGGYATFDAQIGYKINDHAQFTLTGKNIFDRVYFDRLPTSFFGIYGEPRSVMADLKVTW